MNMFKPDRCERCGEDNSLYNVGLRFPDEHGGVEKREFWLCDPCCMKSRKEELQRIKRDYCSRCGRETLHDMVYADMFDDDFHKESTRCCCQTKQKMWQCSVCGETWAHLFDGGDAA